MKNAETFNELTDQVLFLVHTSRVAEPELISFINDVHDGLRRVGSEKAVAIADIVGKARDEALKIFPKVERNVELKRIALWASGVQMGWI